MRPLALLLLFLPLCAHAQVYKWKDENGKIHYSERPMSGSAQGVQNRMSSGAEVCDTACQARMGKDRFDARLEEELRNIPPGTCTARYHAINRTSRELAQAAVRECKMNYAMSRIDPNYKPSTKAQEASKRQNQAVANAVDKAIEREQRRADLQEMESRLEDQIRRQPPQLPQEIELRNRNNPLDRQTCTRNALGDYDCRR